MAAEDMEVSVKLSPLSRGEEQNSRTIKLNDDKKEIQIGRASKNLHKGINATSDNAWFDYPILSRAHAKLSITLPRKILFVKDLGSTHGTYLRNKRLEQGVNHILHDGEVITFGQQVTSGAVTYPAKQFRVHSQWASRVPPVMARIVDKKTTTTFHVPDESDESSSERSREASVEILDSHPRTFSVPSSESGSDSEEDSDDESVEIASSVQGEDKQESRAKSPDKATAAEEQSASEVEEFVPEDAQQNKARSLNLKGPSIVNVLSKSEPVKAKSFSNRDEIDDETEDEAPELLPIERVSAKDTTWNEPKPLRRQFPFPTADDFMADLRTDEQVERLIVESGNRVATRNSEKSSRIQSPDESAVGFTDGFESSDDDGFDRDDDFSICGGDETLSERLAAREPPYIPEEFDTGRPLSMPKEAAKPETTQKEPSIQKQSSPKADKVHNTGDYNNVLESHVRYRPWTHRAPSPSDAALARNLSPAFHNLGNDHWCGTSTLCDNGHFDMQMRHENPMVSGVMNYAPFGYQHVRPMSYPELPGQDAQSRPYDQGPFISPYQGVAAPGFAPWMPSHNSFDRAGGQPGVSTGGETSPAYAQDIAADARYAAKLQAEEDGYAATAHLASKAKPPLAAGGEPRKESDDNQSSKINISNLVNATPLKRKADDISTTTKAEEACNNPPPSTLTTALEDLQKQHSMIMASQGMQDTELPDAQPRSIPIEAASPSQDSTLEPIVASVSVSHPAETEGPPAKKTKTSSGSSKGNGVGKFVSGVCFGLIGAFAAFVATIPASVREEALREVANAV